MTDTTPERNEQARTIRIERGNPTPEQIAALTTVLAAASASPAAPAGAAARSLWSARARFARPRPAVGPDGWRSSTLPR